MVFLLEKDMEWFVSHMVSYLILLSVGIVVFIYNVLYLKKKIKNVTVGVFIRFFFSVVCILFGMYISRKDYLKGEQILTFITMMIYVTCLITWKPVISFLIVTLSFGGFYLYLQNDSKAISTATNINLFILYISVWIISVSIYHQNLSKFVLLFLMLEFQLLLKIIK